MFRLALIMYTIVSPTLAGSAVIAVLSMGLDTWVPIVGATVAGFVAAVPISIIIAKKIQSNVI